MKYICTLGIIALCSPIAGMAHVPRNDALPVGDGKVSTVAKSGNVLACRTNFRTGGARHSGGWFHGETWNPLEKPHVRGDVMWPEAHFAVQPGKDSLTIASNGLPVDEPTGVFPIARDDPAFAFDTNPNPIEKQKIAFAIPLNPAPAETPGCLSMGVIGYTLTGVAFFSALDDAGHDAAAHEVQDLCNGHPQGKGLYHYHNSSPCLPGAEQDAVVGWALDGYPIMGMRDADGHRLTNQDLDPCHGRAESVDVDGRHYSYAYRLTMEYPYTLGCFSGQVPAETRASIRRSLGPPVPRGPDGRPRRGGQD